MNTDQIKRDLEEVDCVAEVTIWRGVARSLGPGLIPGDVTSISVDMMPADGTEPLIDVMKEHELVIKEASCGYEGLNIKLQKEGRVHDQTLADRVETFADLADVSNDEYTRLIDAVQVIRDFTGEN